MTRRVLETLTLAAALSLLGGCSSKALPDDENAGGSSAGGNKNTGGSQNSGCSAALRQSVSLVDEVSTAAVSVLDRSGGELTLYVDASVGGVEGIDTHPWVYLSLATGQAVAETDISAFSSTAWDLALKRSMIRSNSGDSGPGSGGAIRIALPWDAVDASTLGDKSLPIELWFEPGCVIKRDATNNLITTFSDWSEYNQTSHVLSPAPDVVYITAGGDGALYKVAVLDYYSKPDGTHGIETGIKSDSGRYKLRVAPLK